jgi:uncharacterized protein (TIGR02679 family)
LLDALTSVIAALPTSRGESLSAFAARVTGRAHALDDSSPLGTLALGAARALAWLEPPGPDESPADARREAWAAVGVLCDELSSSVLTLALPGDASATGAVLAAAGDEPVWLTLRQLVRSQPQWQAIDVPWVLVVENPSVLALASDMLGRQAVPMVCTNGQPRAATMVLLRSLAGAGVRLCHHGDFDWGGLRIGNLLHRRLTVEPWHFDHDAYMRAVAAHPYAATLRGSPTAAGWDRRLAEDMSDAGLCIEEELVAREVLETLL